MRGTVALPHGWTTANKSLLVATGPEALEPLSGMAHYNGLVVTVDARTL